MQAGFSLHSNSTIEEMRPHIMISLRCLFLMLCAGGINDVVAEDPWSSETSTDPAIRLTASNFEATVFHSGSYND